MTIHFRHTWYAGWMALGVSALLATARPDPGPGLVACAGLSAAGLFLAAGLRGLLSEPQLHWPFQRWIPHADRWFPIVLISLQNYFITLALLPLWFATADLGFPATPALHILLLLLFMLAPLRRILQGTNPPEPTVAREVFTEFLRYFYVCVIALFVTLLISRMNAPAQDQPAAEPSVGAIFLWLPCILINLGSFVLFVDHLVRKLPPPPAPETKDTLD